MILDEDQISEGSTQDSQLWLNARIILEIERDNRKFNRWVCPPNHVLHDILIIKAFSNRTSHTIDEVHEAQRNALLEEDTRIRTLIKEIKEEIALQYMFANFSATTGWIFDFMVSTERYES